MALNRSRRQKTPVSYRDMAKGRQTATPTKKPLDDFLKLISKDKKSDDDDDEDIFEMVAVVAPKFDPTVHDLVKDAGGSVVHQNGTYIIHGKNKNVNMLDVLDGSAPDQHRVDENDDSDKDPNFTPEKDKSGSEDDREEDIVQTTGGLKRKITEDESASPTGARKRKRIVVKQSASQSLGNQKKSAVEARKINGSRPIYKDPVFMCPECDYVSISQVGLARHMLRHRDKREYWECPDHTCSYKSKFKNHIFRHIYRQCKRSDSHAAVEYCSLCLTAHQNGAKSCDCMNVKTFQCALCPYHTYHGYKIQQHYEKFHKVLCCLHCYEVLESNGEASCDCHLKARENTPNTFTNTTFAPVKDSDSTLASGNFCESEKAPDNSFGKSMEPCALCKELSGDAELLKQHQFVAHRNQKTGLTKNTSGNTNSAVTSETDTYTSNSHATRSQRNESKKSGISVINIAEKCSVSLISDSDNLVDTLSGDLGVCVDLSDITSANDELVSMETVKRVKPPKKKRNNRIAKSERNAVQVEYEKIDANLKSENVIESDLQTVDFNTEINISFNDETDVNVNSEIGNKIMWEEIQATENKTNEVTLDTASGEIIDNVANESEEASVEIIDNVANKSKETPGEINDNVATESKDTTGEIIDNIANESKEQVAPAQDDGGLTSDVKPSKPCAICSELSGDKELLRQHQLDIHKLVSCAKCCELYINNKCECEKTPKKRQYQFKCDICTDTSQITFNNRERVRKHMKRSHKVDCCENCCASFKDGSPSCNCTEEDIEKARKRRRGSSKPERPKMCACDECDFRGVNYTALHTHLYKQHNRPARFECRICLRMFQYSYDYRVHVSVHFKPDAKTLTELSLEQHVQLFLNHGPSGLPSSILEQIKSYKEGLGAEVQGEGGQDAVKENVSPQQDANLTKDDSKEHLQDEEENTEEDRTRPCIKGVICTDFMLSTQSYEQSQADMPQCERGLLYPKIIRTKQTEEDNTKGNTVGRVPDENRFVCQICQSAFSSALYLRQHIYKLHPVSGDKVPKRPKMENPKIIKRKQGKIDEEYRCTKCDFVCYRIASFTNHLKSHVAAKYKCSQCDYQHNLERHVRAHERDAHGPPSHPCEYCHKKYGSLTKKKTHIRKVHAMKEYVCEHCGDKFVTARDFERHQLVHREGAVTCELCGKSYIGEQAWRTHVRSCVSRSVGDMGTEFYVIKGDTAEVAAESGAKVIKQETNTEEDESFIVVMGDTDGQLSAEQINAIVQAGVKTVMLQNTQGDLQTIINQSVDGVVEGIEVPMEENSEQYAVEQGTDENPAPEEEGIQYIIAEQSDPVSDEQQAQQQYIVAGEQGQFVVADGQENGQFVTYVQGQNGEEGEFVVAEQSGEDSQFVVAEQSGGDGQFVVAEQSGEDGRFVVAEQSGEDGQFVVTEQSSGDGQFVVAKQEGDDTPNTQIVIAEQQDGTSTRQFVVADTDDLPTEQLVVSQNESGDQHFVLATGNDEESNNQFVVKNDVQNGQLVLNEQNTQYIMTNEAGEQRIILNTDVQNDQLGDKSSGQLNIQNGDQSMQFIVTNEQPIETDDVNNVQLDIQSSSQINSQSSGYLDVHASSHFDVQSQLKQEPGNFEQVADTIGQDADIIGQNADTEEHHPGAVGQYIITEDGQTGYLLTDENNETKIMIQPAMTGDLPDSDQYVFASEVDGQYVISEGLGEGAQFVISEEVSEGEVQQHIQYVVKEEI